MQTSDILGSRYVHNGEVCLNHIWIGVVYLDSYVCRNIMLCVCSLESIPYLDRYICMPVYLYDKSGQVYICMNQMIPYLDVLATCPNMIHTDVYLSANEVYLNHNYLPDKCMSVQIK